ncbi:hypothetical protein BX616_004361, partial [Lobosporangium transversale]
MRIFSISLSVAIALFLSQVQAQDVPANDAPINAASVDAAGDELVSLEGLKQMDKSIFPSAEELESRINLFQVYASDSGANSDSNAAEDVKNTEANGTEKKESKGSEEKEKKESNGSKKKEHEEKSAKA